eukprot:8735988-Lingulodinium_polyedra.AAC.1
MAGAPGRRGAPASPRSPPKCAGASVAAGPSQMPADRPRDLLPFPRGAALDELLLGASATAHSAGTRRKARRQRAEEAWLRDGLEALSSLGGGGRAAS